MTRRAAAIVAGLAAVLVLAGCAPDAGTVRGKEFDRGHYVYTTQCTTTGKSTTCHPVPIWDDDDWRILLDDGKDRGWVDVDQGTYDSLRLGDHYDRKARR